MAKEYDTSGKELIKISPLDWLHLVGIDATDARMDNVNLTAVQKDADSVIQVEAPERLIAQIELQSSYDPDVVDRIASYKALLRSQGIRVVSAVVLLTRAADGPLMTGFIDEGVRGDGSWFGCDYRVIRLWQLPVSQILSGGFGTLPLASLAEIPDSDLPAVMRRVQQRIEEEADPVAAGKLITTSYVLAGLKYDSDFVQRLMRSVTAMKNSSTYQAILLEGRAEGKAEGKIEEARELLFALGERRLGPPSDATVAAITAIGDPDHLKVLALLTLETESWQELLGKTHPPHGPHNIVP